MKKNTCPYLDSQNRCTHKLPKTAKGFPNCIYSNPLKCRMHNEWLESTKSLRMAKNNDEAIIRKWVEDFKSRCNKK